MSQFRKGHRSRSGLAGKLFAGVGAILLLTIAAVAYADEPYSMAPPVSSSGDYTGGGTGAASSVFNWQEIPENQNVPISRAVFDKGGYQLYDTAGETIIVPFKDNNLYVMKFAVSGDGSTYFINTGTEPVLYIPQDGYLENASDSGARWYPFTPKWHPSTPVFVGIAPSWDDYVAMGWYPNMDCYGGYWCSEPYFTVGAVFPAFGLFFEIGGDHYWGWHPYSDYCRFHPAPYHVRIVNDNFYRWGGEHWRDYAGDNHPFRGTGRPYVNGRGFVADHGGNFAGHTTGGRTFMGAGRPYTIGRGFDGHASAGSAFHGTSNASNHSFRSTTSHDSGSFHGSAGSYGDTPSGNHSFHGVSGAGNASHGSDHSFQGGQSSGFDSHTAASSHTFSGANRQSYSPNAGAWHASGTDHSFSGGSPSHSVAPSHDSGQGQGPGGSGPSNGGQPRHDH